MSLCEAKIKTDQLMIRTPCKSEFSFTIYRQARVRLGRFPIVVTTTYQVNIEPLGFALGRHLFSVPLTPGEEVEIEVFRSAKVERELSQQFSTEVEFTEEFAHTFKYEWSKERESSYKESSGVSVKIDLGIIEAEVHHETEHSESEREFQRVIDEVVQKTKLRVDKKFDMHVGLKTEVENRYRSTRRIKNPNLCRTLTYNYFQLMRKVKITVRRTGIRFDWPRVWPRIFEKPIPVVVRTYSMPPMELKKLVATREERPDSAEASNPQRVVAATVNPAAIASATMGAVYAPSTELEMSTPDVKTMVHPIIREPHVLELTKERVLAKMDKMKAFERAEEKRKLGKEMDRLRARFPIGKVVCEREMCINTNSMHVEPMMGLCLACEGHKLELANLEVEKAKAELEKLKGEADD